MPKVSRRHFLKAACSAGIAATLPGCASNLPLNKDIFHDFGDDTHPFLGLATSLREEHDYEAAVEGRIPPRLRGVLYRNGPGLFDRGRLRKRTLIDGDGMVQSFDFHEHGVRYRNRFVRTMKFMEEDAAGKFTRPTWSTQAPGGWLANVARAGDVSSQAGISAIIWNGCLYAFDESSLPYELDPVTLETKGESTFGLPRNLTIYSGHPKMDPLSGEWLHFGVRHGPSPQVNITIFDRNGSLKSHRAIAMPRYVYMHDWFATPRRLILSFNPLQINVWGFLLGQKSLFRSLRWRPEWGTLLVVLDRAGENAPVMLETDPYFMWHSVTAVDEGDEVVADFIGYREPDHIIGRDPCAAAVMEGRAGSCRWAGEMRRYRIDLQGAAVRQQCLYDGRCEWPRVNQRHLLSLCRYVYAVNSRQGEFFWSALTRFDRIEGKEEQFMFPVGTYCCEPVFVEDPERQREASSRGEEGWVLCQIYESGRRKSSLAVFDAMHVADGPVAMVRLSHHVPFSYHGWWQERA